MFPKKKSSSGECGKDGASESTIEAEKAAEPCPITVGIGDSTGGQEAQALCQDILIGVTSFFRDPEVFAILAERLLPQLLAKRDPNDPLRIWHACCATGEEVYSMAMLIREYLNKHQFNVKVLIFASDIDEVAISQARTGLYSDDIAAEVGEERLKTFFTRTTSHWQVTKSLREMIIFTHHSPIKDPPFSQLDLLVCRNFLIHLNPDMQKRLITLFHQVLKPRGFLFLGSSETVGHQSDLFAPMDKKRKIFERLESGRSREMLVRQLEEQRITYEQLQATSEHLESSNEGFISANEELMSINEEFITVNAELRGKLEELNQANSDIENLLASSGIATLFLDRQLNIKRFTPAMAGIFNLIPADVGRPFRHLAGTADWPGLGRDAQTVLEKLVPIEREVTAQEGGRSHIMRVLPYRTTDGRVDGIVVTLLDITGHKLAEKALRRAKEEWERTFACVPDLITILDNQHRVLRVNEAMAKRLGLKPEECVGLSCYEAIHGTSVPPWFCPHSRTIEDGGEHIAELHVDRFEGDFIVTTTPLLDEIGERIGSVHIAHDITERKRMEDILKQLNEELENRVAERTAELADTIEYLQFEVAERENAEEKLLRLNRLHAMLSETNQAIVRTRDRDTIFNDFCRIAVEDGGFKLAWVGLLDKVSGELRKVAANGATSYLDGIRITANEEPEGLGPIGRSVRNGADHIVNDFQGSPTTRPWHERGRIHGIHAAASIALRQEGLVIGALALYADKKDFFDRQQIELLRQMGADISFALDNIVRETRRREAEQALQKETAERLRAVEALREKEQMLIQQSRQAAMGEMIGNIAHQWRQPLNALGLTIQGLLLFYDLDEFNREFLEKGVSSSMELIQHMSRTIDDFRNYFRPDKEKSEFKVAEAVKNTLSLIEDSFKNQHISIEVAVIHDPAIYGYRNEFAQALLNILNNARDALTERNTDDPKVTIAICSEGDRAVVTVADNAGGISEEIMGKIFDPYFTTKGPQSGTGVGLFMSKTIIEKNMGGKLIACNIANGAEFRIEV